MHFAAGISGRSKASTTRPRVCQNSEFVSEMMNFVFKNDGFCIQKGEPGDSEWKGCNEGPSAWEKFYLQDPVLNASGATPQQLELIIGGEASTWGDCISAESFDTMTWPAGQMLSKWRFSIEFQLKK